MNIRMPDLSSPDVDEQITEIIQALRSGYNLIDSDIGGTDAFFSHRALPHREVDGWTDRTHLYDTNLIGVEEAAEYLRHVGYPHVCEMPTNIQTVVLGLVTLANSGHQIESWRVVCPLASADRGNQRRLWVAGFTREIDAVTVRLFF